MPGGVDNGATSCEWESEDDRIVDLGVPGLSLCSSVSSRPISILQLARNRPVESFGQKENAFEYKCNFKDAYVDKLALAVLCCRSCLVGWGLDGGTSDGPPNRGSGIGEFESFRILVPVVESCLFDGTTL